VLDNQNDHRPLAAVEVLAERRRGIHTLPLVYTEDPDHFWLAEFQLRHVPGCRCRGANIERMRKLVCTIKSIAGLACIMPRQSDKANR